VFEVLLETSPHGDEQYLDWLLDGLFWTVLLALSGWIIAFFLGVAIGCARTATRCVLALPARLYVEIFRNIPILVQMFLWYFVLPELLPVTLGHAMKQWVPPWGSFFPALAALSLYTTARVAEQVKAGIEALPPGQRAAARALGMSEWQVYRRILLPQALRIITPTLTSEMMGIFKNTSVALTIGLLELTAQARQISEYTFQTFSAFGAATLLYLGLALLVFLVMRAMEHHYRIPSNSPVSARYGQDRDTT